MPDLAYKHVLQEPLLAVQSSDHRLASRNAVTIQDIARETFIGMSKTAPSPQIDIDTYLKGCGVAIRAEREGDNLAMAISLVASTRGVTLMPGYARSFLPSSVVSRPLKGVPPTIDLVIGYHKVNAPPVLRLFLERSDALIARVANKVHAAPDPSSPRR